jgi:hypothetical protein
MYQESFFSSINSGASDSSYLKKWKDFTGNYNYSFDLHCQMHTCPKLCGIIPERSYLNFQY